MPEVANHDVPFQLTGLGVLQVEHQTGQFVRVNQAFCGLVGYSEAELLGMCWQELAHPDDLADMSLIRQGEEGNRVARCVRKDGTLIWLEPHVTTFRDEAQKEYALVVVSDVSQNNRAEAALQQSENQWQLTVDSITDYAILTLNTEGIITGWNTGAERTFGYSKAEAIGQLAELIFTPEDCENGVPLKEMRLARETGRGSDDRWHLAKDGRQFFVNGTVMPLREGNDNERLLGYVKVARDLTAQRQAAAERERLVAELKELNEHLEQRVEERTAELRQSERRFSQAFQLGPVAACLSSLGKETFIEVNEMFCQLTGYSREEVISKDVFRLEMWSSKEDQAKVEAARRDGDTFHNLELELRDKAGGAHAILLSGSIIELDDERVNLKMFYDISERKRTEEQLHRAIQEVMSDTSWFSRKLLERLATVKSGRTEAPVIVKLSRREQQVLERVAMGMSNDDIATDLSLSAQTVRNYISIVYDKIGVRSRAEAVVWARERGIIGG